MDERLHRVEESLPVRQGQDGFSRVISAGRPQPPAIRGMVVPEPEWMAPWRFWEA